MPMSFSSEVRDELAQFEAGSRHCLIAELSALISMGAKVSNNKLGNPCIIFTDENKAVADKFVLYVHRAFGYNLQVTTKGGTEAKKCTYKVVVDDPAQAVEILMATKIMVPDQEISGDLLPRNAVVVKNDCCKRSFIRGAFLTAGSISDPEKFYHFEIVCTSMAKAEFIQKIILSFQFDARIVQRKKYYVVYIKEGEQIVDLLNIMMAHRALLNLENVRILKEVRNTINRQVNCETANLNRTVSAAVKQVEDINYIKDTVGLDTLSDQLREIAIIRLDNTETSLKEIGLMLTPPVGKSGVNHRLRKISEIADELRNK